MDDDQVHGRIQPLVSEERELWRRESEGSATADERRRLESLNLSHDQEQ